MINLKIDMTDRIKVARIKSFLAMFFACISFFISLILVMTLFQMGGKVTVMSQLFSTTRGTDSMVYNDILNNNVGDRNLLEKAFVIKYIEEKNFVIPDSPEMQRRWGPLGKLSLMSHPAVFRPVYRYDDDRVKDMEDVLPQHADNIQILSRAGNDWRVQFDLWTHTQTGSYRRRQEATLHLESYSGRRQTIATQGYFYNPLGLTVTSYNVTTLN